MLKFALLFAVLFQMGAAVQALSLIRRTRFNVSWILISSGFVLMALRRLFDFSALFWDSKFFPKEEVNSWIGVLISVLMFVGVIFIRKIFDLQSHIEQIREESETRVLSAVIQTEEIARQKFARELHDGLGPVLSSVKMTLSAIDTGSLSETNKRIVERSELSVNEAITSLKEISNHLSPHLLKNYGLAKAVRTFADQFFEGTTIRVNICPAIQRKRYAYDLEINVYRIVCELFNNSLRHANPANISLKMSEKDRALIVFYQDDGSGFDAGEYLGLAIRSGMGLDNIVSRVKSLKGKYVIDSAPNKGFSFQLTIPAE
ncbi:MAG: histidine kinase [Prolixibacteraceae bacterium]